MTHVAGPIAMGAGVPVGGAGGVALAPDAWSTGPSRIALDTIHGTARPSSRASIRYAPGFVTTFSNVPEPDAIGRPSWISHSRAPAAAGTEARSVTGVRPSIVPPKSRRWPPLVAENPRAEGAST